MVANYRCSELKSSLVEKSLRQFGDLKMDMKMNPNLDLGMKYDAIL